MSVISGDTKIPGKIRIFIVDDHSVVREGLCSVLKNETDMYIAGEAESGEQAIDMAGQLAPDIILLDLKMSGMDGFATAKILRTQCPDVKIIMLTGYESELYAAEATECGIYGFLGKNTPRKLLLNSIRVVNDGGTVFNYTDMLHANKTSDLPMPGNTGDSNFSDVILKPRDREILSLIVKGMANKEIAIRLGLAEITIKKINSRLFAKLNVVNRTQAALAANRLGII